MGFNLPIRAWYKNVIWKPTLTASPTSFAIPRSIPEVITHACVDKTALIRPRPNFSRTLGLRFDFKWLFKLDLIFYTSSRAHEFESVPEYQTLAWTNNRNNHFRFFKPPLFLGNFPKCLAPILSMTDPCSHKHPIRWFAITMGKDSI